MTMGERRVVVVEEGKGEEKEIEEEEAEEADEVARKERTTTSVEERWSEKRDQSKVRPLPSELRRESRTWS